MDEIKKDFDRLEVVDRISEFTNKNIVVNCQVGQRGHTAALLLKEYGFNALNLDGGYFTWSNSPAHTQTTTEKE